MFIFKEEIINAVLKLSKAYNADAELIDTEYSRDSIVLTFDSSRFGGFFEPRSGEQDDDCPSFIGEQSITREVNQIVGNNFKVVAYEHEKGMFSVEVYKK